MKLYWLLRIVAASATIVSAAQPFVLGQGNSASTTPTSAVEPLLGRWDLTMKTGKEEYPSWFELQQQDGQLKIRIQGRRGSMVPLPEVAFSNGLLTFGYPKYHWSFQGRLAGATMTGEATGPDGVPLQWVGVRAPALTRAKAPRWGSPIVLFNGRDLTGWTMDQPGPPVWTVHDGTLVSPGHGPELISDNKFEDFKLHIEFNCGDTSNSGIFLRGRYEVQVENDSVKQPPSHHTGGVYGFLNATPEQPRTTGQWQTFDITLVGRRITVVQNGVTVLDDEEIPGITGGALDSHEALPGPIYLQGSEPGHVSFRNIVLTPVL
jgi:Domain of Unknown Function (DUF1080)